LQDIYLYLMLFLFIGLAGFLTKRFGKMPIQEVWDEYPEVYHYTKFSTAPLIIHSSTLRATRFDLLNDTEEINYAKHIIAERIFEKVEGASQEQVNQAIELFSQALGENFYITSFCGKNTDAHRDNGLLSMWRHYGLDGGCAIIFKTQKIYERAISTWESLEIPPAYVMDKAIYKGENDNNEDYQQKLNRFASYVAEKLVNPTPDPTESEIYETRRQLEDLLCLLICSKHPSFFEEREVRLGICFIRNIDGTSERPQKQFHKISFSPGEDIYRIIIGPHRDQKERFDFLKAYLSQIYPNIEVTMSEIPLRF
jgi:hypothetical protein